jgi:hypothetical protein
MPDLLLRAHIWLVATLFPLLERLLPLRGLLWLAEQPSGWTPYRGVPSDRIVALVDRRLSRPRQMRRRRCLRQGMTLFHFLRLAGVTAELRIGVLGPAASGRRLQGHCWVNIAGRDLYPPSGNFVVLLTRVFTAEDSNVSDKA